MITMRPLLWISFALLLQVSCSGATSYFETCDSATGSCQTQTCTVASDCSTENAECLSSGVSGLCACIMGYSQRNRACTKVLGRVCAADIDCDMDRAECSDTENVCECGNKYFEENGICVSYYGQPCDHWDHCTTFTGLGYYVNDYMGCFDVVCQCTKGYQWIDETCTSILWRRCESAADCPDSSVYCHNKYCRCMPTMTNSQSGHGCVHRLGSNCDQIWDCTHEHGMFCNVANNCTCLSGLMERDHVCVGVLDWQCNTDDDCGDSPAYECAEEGFCNCSAGFSRAPGSGEGSYFGDICEPELGAWCTNANECETESSVCDDYTCACGTGYFEVNGFCIQVVGAYCERDETCRLLPGTRCGVQGKCECAEGFLLSADGLRCVAVTSCTLTSDCSSNQICQNDRCIAACHDGVPEFPTSIHRGWLYVVSPFSEEPLVDDSYDEGLQWRSMGIWEPWSPASGEDTPVLGQCGTYHPIYLQNALQWSNVEVSATAVVGGTSETLSVRCRKCGDNFHVFSPPPATKMSAWCSKRILQHAESYTQRAYMGSMWLQATLGYKAAVIDGANWNVPELTFSATTYSSWDDNYYYMMNWYANGNFVTAKGPWKGSDLNNNTRPLDMTEDDLWRNGGYRAGCNIQSSLQIFETLISPASGERFSNLYKTGVTTNEWSGYHTIYQAGDTDPYPARMTHAPIGCLTPEIDGSYFCHHGFDFADDSSDSNCFDDRNSIGEDHLSCGLVLSGLTYRGQEEAGFSSPYYTTEYEGSVRVNQQRGLFIQTNASEPHRLSNVLSAKFQAASTAEPVHAFWEGYVPPELFFKVQGITESQFSCYMSQQGGVQMAHTRQTNWQSGQVPLIRVGRFIAIYDPSQVVAVQIELEDCTDSDYGTRVCVCGVTVRIDNTIYTKSICGGIKREGAVYGDATLVFSPHTGYYGDASFYAGNLNVNIYSSASNVSVYGICSAVEGNYMLRSGMTSDDWELFLDSWRVQEGEDLLEPETHVDFAVTEKTYSCTCPEAGDNVPDTVIAYERTTYRTEYEYMSAIHCSLQKQCIKETPGLEWLSDLVPESEVGEVTVSGRVDVARGQPSVTFTCNFETDPRNQYKVLWTADDMLVKEFEPFAADDVLTNSALTESELAESEFVSTHGQSAVLDASIVCGVIQMTGDVEAPVVNSEPYTVLGMPATELNILRGGQTTLTIHKNAKLWKGNNEDEDVEWDFTVFDEEDPDSTCHDSQIAVGNPHLCGARIRGKALGVDRVQRDTDEDRVVNMVLRNVNNHGYSPKDTFTMRLKTVLRFRGQKYLSYVVRQKITIFVRDEGFWQRRLCYSNNDPNMITFDGSYYYNNGNGTYVMYRNLHFPVEVQLIVRPCNNGWGTCSCGVILRAGSDVYIINHCDNKHVTGWLREGNPQMKIYKISSTKITVKLPQGTQVDITFSPWRWYIVNVYIYASPADVSSADGLCGFFNGDPTDDWRLPNGEQDVVTPTLTWWWWRYHPTTFIEAWKLKDEESLLDADVVAGLDDWPDKDKLCKCPGSHDSEDAMCSANEDDTCTDGWRPPGEAVSHSARTARLKRSTGYVLNNDIKRRVAELRERFSDSGTDEIGRVKRSTVEATDEEAKADCELLEDPTFCPALDIAELLEGDKNGTLLKCFSDNKLNKNFKWAKEACRALQNQVDTMARKDTDFQTAQPNKLAEATSYCDGDCDGNGFCDAGTCRCNPGFSSDCCTINAAVPPTVLRIFNNGFCDPNVDGDCICHHIETDGNANDVTCKIHEIEALKGNTQFKVVTTYNDLAIVAQLNELYCCIRSLQESQGRRRKRAVSSGEEVVAQGAMFSLSNDNTTFGDDQYVFVLDATCQEVQNTTNGWTLLLKAGYCYIDGTCYTDTTTSGTGCGVCNSTYSLFDWQETCEASRGDDGGDDLGLVIGVSVGVTVAVLVAAGLLATLLIMKKKKAITPVINMGLYDGVRDSSPPKKFMLRDDRPLSGKWM